jgi:hypothetical protein
MTIAEITTATHEIKFLSESQCAINPPSMARDNHEGQ